ncbi:MAG TPA: hypothetical protein VIJ14_06180, partial [Rhabdochlamydiaceae bacterium]
ILRGNKDEGWTIAEATIILFPKSDVMIADTMFEALWKLGKKRQAIQIYRKVGRLFWHAEAVGRYYERQGQMSKAVQEYEYLMNEYSRMSKKGILPLPPDPRELFVLGQWYASRDKLKSRKYLELYLSSENYGIKDSACYLRHKNAARRILDRLERPRDVVKDLRR